MDNMRHNSDYKDFFTATQEDALEQVSATELFVDAVDKYLIENHYTKELIKQPSGVLPPEAAFIYADLYTEYPVEANH